MMSTRPLAHVRYGQGTEPLVLLHGFLGSARNLGSLARALVGHAPSLTVLGVDLTGHGGSPALPPDADLATLASDVLATARGVLGAARALALVGHSLGGRVALRAAQLDDGAIRHVTLLDISPSPVAADAETARVLEALLAAPARAASRAELRASLSRAGLARPIVEWLLLNARPREGEYRWTIDRVALADFHRRTAVEDLWPAVERPHRFTLHVIRGARSPYVTEADARRFERAGARVDTLDGAGHFLHVDRPRELLECMLAGLPVREREFG